MVRQEFPRHQTRPREGVRMPRVKPRRRYEKIVVAILPDEQTLAWNQLAHGHSCIFLHIGGVGTTLGPA